MECPSVLALETENGMFYVLQITECFRREKTQITRTHCFLCLIRSLHGGHQEILVSRGNGRSSFLQLYLYRCYGCKESTHRFFAERRSRFFSVLYVQTPNLRPSCVLGHAPNSGSLKGKLGIPWHCTQQLQAPNGLMGSELPTATAVWEGAEPCVVVSRQEADFPCKNSRKWSSEKFFTMEIH